MNIPGNEERLLRELATGDKKTVEAIYRDNFSMVESFVIRSNGSSDDARDVFQEAMIVLYEKARSGTFELKCQLKTFIYAVCKRLWLKKLQQQQYFYKSTDDHEEVSVEEDMEVHERRNTEFQMMEAAMAKVGEPCKSLLEAYYLEKKSMPEIAEYFGYTNADNAKNQKYEVPDEAKEDIFCEL